MISIRVEGLSRLDANLRRLSEPMQRRLIREALRTSAEPMRVRMSQLAPVDPDPETGEHLKDNIGIGNARGIDRAEIAIAVGPASKTYYGSFQELGTADFPAQPFARPAFDETVMQALHIFARELWDEVKRKFGGGRIVQVIDAPVDVIGGPGGGGLL